MNHGEGDAEDLHEDANQDLPANRQAGIGDPGESASIDRVGPPD